jgi:hypothetical protein
MTMTNTPSTASPELSPNFEKTLSRVWDKGEFEAHYNALSKIVNRREELCDEAIYAVKEILMEMDVFRNKKQSIAA